MFAERSLLTSALALWVNLAGLMQCALADTVVFTTDFEAALPAEISPGSATPTAVQGYAGLGPLGNQFGGTFLRSATGNVVTLTLSGLPTHDRIHLDFLFAAIDSLDGTGTFPSGDFFRITLDGIQVFRESFANALDSQVQSYVSPPGVELARRVPLGFTNSSVHTDSAYYLGADPTFQNFTHSAATAAITFQIEGEGIQDINDESWAMENLRVAVWNSENADFDDNGEVDGRDFLTWQRNIGATGQTGNSNGDANFDGTIDGDDLVVWETQYGTEGLLTAAAAAVPEPGSAFLALVGVLALVPRLAHTSLKGANNPAQGEALGWRSGRRREP